MINNSNNSNNNSNNNEQQQQQQQQAEIRDDADLKLRQIALVTEIVSLWDREETDNRTIKSKIKELAFTVEEIYLRYDQHDLVKYVFRDICNLLRKAGGSESIRKYAWQSLQEETRYFDKYDSSSHLASSQAVFTVDSSTYFEEMKAHLEATKRLDPTFLTREQLHELLDLQQKGESNTIEIYEDSGIPIPSSKPHNWNDYTNKTDDEFSDTISEKQGPPTLNDVTEALRELGKAFNRMADTFELKGSKIINDQTPEGQNQIRRFVKACRAFGNFLRPVYDSKYRTTMLHWAHIIRNNAIYGGTAAHNRSGTPCGTEIDPATGQPKLRPLTKEQIDSKGLTIANQMIELIDHFGFFLETCGVFSEYILDDRNDRASGMEEKLSHRR